MKKLIASILIVIAILGGIRAPQAKANDGAGIADTFILSVDFVRVISANERTISLDAYYDGNTKCFGAIVRYSQNVTRATLSFPADATIWNFPNYRDCNWGQISTRVTFTGPFSTGKKYVMVNNVGTWVKVAPVKNKKGK